LQYFLSPLYGGFCVFENFINGFRQCAMSFLALGYPLIGRGFAHNLSF
jgi:hypothetical protein